MTSQEILWSGKRVLIASIRAKSGAIHLKHRKYIGRTGIVVGETKGGMLLVRFKRALKSDKFIGVPASCLCVFNDPALKLKNPKG